MELKMIECKSCKEDMPELRLSQYGYDFCVNCSESGNRVKAKHGVNVMMGEGDHTWIETVIMDEDQYRKYQQQEHADKNLGDVNEGKAEMVDMLDDRNLHGPVTIRNENGK
jgi:hypothetical protein